MQGKTQPRVGVRLPEYLKQLERGQVSGCKVERLPAATLSLAQIALLMVLLGALIEVFGAGDFALCRPGRWLGRWFWG